MLGKFAWGGLDVQATARANARFEAMVDESFFVLLPNADDFALANRYLGRFETRLRAGDALHLAITNNHRARVVYSLVAGWEDSRPAVKMGIRVSS
ncbi:MAG: hypothetical protein WBX30_02805 [Stellaceae bacterium]